MNDNASEHATDLFIHFYRRKYNSTKQNNNNKKTTVANFPLDRFNF